MLYIIRGIPGSGKSTLAKEMLKSGEVQKHYETDMFFVKDGEYLFDATKIKVAHQWCQESTKTALAGGFDVVVSNTFIKKWEMAPYLKMSKLNGGFEIIECHGGYNSIHSVPRDVIERMKNNWEVVFRDEMKGSS